jgi:hypothetical protein
LRPLITELFSVPHSCIIQREDIYIQTKMSSSSCSLRVQFGHHLFLHKKITCLTVLNESTTFCNKLCVFSLLFYIALHVSAYKQAIFKCFLTNHKKVKLLSYFSVDPPSHDITIVLANTSKYSINTLCVQGVILHYKNRIKNISKKPRKR